MIARTPAITLANPPLKIFASRDGDQVTGRVEFPHPIRGQSSIPISYRNAPTPDPQPPPPNPRSPAPDRFAAVQHFLELAKEQPTLTQAKRAQAVGIPLRTLQSWIRRYETEGLAGLTDRYIPKPKRVISLDPADAKDAICICAWWAYRIGNQELIDSAMMQSAAAIAAQGHPLQDVMATIDCYYAWPADRDRYPFKPFSRWARHDFDKWCFRARDDADHHRAMAGAKTRKREVAHTLRQQGSGLRPQTSSLAPPLGDSARLLHGIGLHATARQAIIDQGRNPSRDPNPSRDRKEAVDNPSRDREEAVDNPSRDREEAVDNPSRDRKEAVDNPSRDRKGAVTLAESILRLPDSYRIMLLDAAHGDRRARQQARSTMPLWWDSLPQETRDNLDAREAAWARQHPGARESLAAHRKLDSLLPMIRARNAGTQRLGVALKISQPV